ncbi:MAG TPA: hypothetical protein VE569_04470, partial [Acidimicrobiia bacterium]|nr:hypothetical protein [Acidimicrobiia bacterium]
RQRVLDDVDALMTAPDEEPASTVGLPPSTPASVGTLTRTPGRADLPARDPGLNEKAMLGLFAVVTAVVGLIGLAVSAQIDPVDLAAVTGSGDRAAAPVNTTTTSLPTSTANPESSGSDQTAPPTGPGVIEVSANAIDFGDDETNAQFEITNTGGQPVEFTVTSSVDTVVLSAGGGELGAGESVTYDVLLDRENMVEGEMNESIRVAWEGEPVVIAVTASQIDDPILHAPQADPSTVQVKGCGNTTTKVSVRVRDRSPLASVVVRWSPDGGDTTETPMLEVGGDFFEATIGPFTTVHTAAVKIVATDEMGYAGGATISVEVTACQ